MGQGEFAWRTPSRCVLLMVPSWLPFPRPLLRRSNSRQWSSGFTSRVRFGAGLSVSSDARSSVVVNRNRFLERLFRRYTDSLRVLHGLIFIEPVRRVFPASFCRFVYSTLSGLPFCARVSLYFSGFFFFFFRGVTGFRLKLNIHQSFALENP